MSLNDEDRLALQKFVDDLREVLEWIVLNPEGLIPERMVPALSAAWQEVKPRFGELNTEIGSGENDDRLEDRGLAGAQLRFKLMRFHDLMEQFRAYREAGFPPAERLSPRRRLLGFIYRMLRRRQTGGTVGALMIFVLLLPLMSVGIGPMASSPPKQPGFLRRFFRSLLKNGDVALGSLASAIPVAGEAVREFKDGVVQVVEDVDQGLI
jgi:hypothetical protein